MVASNIDMVVNIVAFLCIKIKTVQTIKKTVSEARIQIRDLQKIALSFMLFWFSCTWVSVQVWGRNVGPAFNDFHTKLMLLNYLFFNSHSVGWSPNWVHSARRPLNGLLYFPPGDYYDGEFGGIKIGRGNRSTRRKPVPAPLYPPQIPLVQTRV
jgi:hypothetical protein